MMPTESFLLVDLVLCVLDVVAELLNDLRERFLRSKLLLLVISEVKFHTFQRSDQPTADASTTPGNC